MVGKQQRGRPKEKPSMHSIDKSNFLDGLDVLLRQRSNFECEKIMDAKVICSFLKLRRRNGIAMLNLSERLLRYCVDATEGKIDKHMST